MLEREARWLYDWGETWILDEHGWNVLDLGTPVLILNCCEFDQPPPWRSTDWLAVGVQLPTQTNLAVPECEMR